MITAYHARYYARELTRRHAADDVDLNPYPIEAEFLARMFEGEDV